MTKKNWSIIFAPKCLKKFKKMDRHIQKKILKYIDDRILPDPHNLAEPLSGNLIGFHRYRFANYRLICKVKDNELTVVLLKIDHRSTVYTTH